MAPSGPEPLERIALDTSAYSHLRRGNAEVIDLIASVNVVELCTTVLGELEAGFRLGSRYRENMDTLEDFLNESFVRVVELGTASASRYASVFELLRRRGTPVPINDIWIAAAALVTGARLVTFDTDFSKIPDFPHTLLKAKRGRP